MPSPDVIYDFRELLANEELRLNAEIDLQRYTVEWQSVLKNIPKEKQAEARTKMIDILVYYNFGIRLANETLIQATHPKSLRDFGELFREARKNPKNFDHGDLHERGTDAMQLLNYILLGTTEHIDDMTGLTIVAAPMKSIYHDQPQLWMQDRKDMHPKDDFLRLVNPRDYHNEAGAFYIHILRPIIQRAGHLSDNLADRFVAVVATGISLHDTPGFKKILLKDNARSAAEFETSAGLYAAYTSGKLNRLTLLPSEWLTILKEKIRETAISDLLNARATEKADEQMKYRFVAEAKERRKVKQLLIDGFKKEVSVEYPPEELMNQYIHGVYGQYGLGAVMEEYYQKELETALDLARRPDWTDNPFSAQTVYIGDSIFNFADLDEMIRGAESEVRKLRVFWSRSRPLILPDTDLREAVREDPEVRGHNQSDWCRQAAEWIEIAKQYADSPFFQDSGYAEFIRNTYLRNMLQAQKLFEELSRGDGGAEYLDDIKLQRILEIAGKVLQKSNLFSRLNNEETEYKQIMAVTDLLNMAGNIWQVRRFIENYIPETNTYFYRFVRQFERICSQIDTVKENLRQKPGPDGAITGYIYQYSKHEIEELKNNFDNVWVEVCRIFGIVDVGRQNELRLILGDEGRTAKSIIREKPIMRRIHMDSVGALIDARTINTLPREIEAKLRETDK